MSKTKLFQETSLDIVNIKRPAEGRRDLGDLTTLKRSIARDGLLQPIVVSRDMRILAGERRLTACAELGWSAIPARVAPAETGPDDFLLIEMVENLERKEFLWHEELDLVLRLHELWTTQAEDSPEDWSYRKTAQKLECSLGGLSSNLDLAKALRSFPQLRDFQTKAKAREAYKKIIHQVKAAATMKAMPEDDQTRIRALLSGEGSVSLAMADKAETAPAGECRPQSLHDDCAPDFQGRSTCERPDPLTPEPPKLPEAVYKVCAWDSLLPDIPDRSVGLVELDPPYAINFDDTYNKPRKRAGQPADWDVERLQAFYATALPTLKDKLLEDAWILVWTGKEHFSFINDTARRAGFGIQDPGVWVKPGGSSNSPTTNMTSCYEMFLLLRAGKATFNTPSLPNVIAHKNAGATDRVHQWEKPVGLYEVFMRALGTPSTYMLSLFAGSGNAMIAAALSGMTPIGCDQSDMYAPMFYDNLRTYFV